MDGEDDAVVALVRVTAEDVLVLPNFLTLLLARTLSGHLSDHSGLCEAELTVKSLSLTSPVLDFISF